MNPRPVAASVFVVVLISAANADTILVPDDYPTIQAAIDAASDGDVVEVSLWITHEAINLRGKAIHVRGARFRTRIDATGLEASVVTCSSGEGPDTVLEDLILIGGSADRGGGMFNLNSSPTLISCGFSENSAQFGGGMYNENSNPSLTNCPFTGNTAVEDGGGMYNFKSSPTISRGGSYFSGNSSRRGGAICNISSTPTLRSVQIRSNSAQFGGGIMNQDSDGTLTLCGIGGNRAAFSGGGIYNERSSPTVNNSLFVGNSARSSGGAMYNGESSKAEVTSCSFIGNTAGLDTPFAGAVIFNNESSPRITNCWFSGNSTRGWGAVLFNDAGSDPVIANCLFRIGEAARAGAVYNRMSSPVLIQCTFVANSAVEGGSVMYSERGSRPSLFNSILWWNESDQIVDEDSHTSIAYSNVEGGYDGVGNMDADPLFVRNPDPGEDGEWGTYDDEFGDLHLQEESPCIDAADNGALPMDVVDLDKDGDTEELLPLDLGGDRRRVDTPETKDTGPGACPIADMGMYEFQASGGCCLRDPRWRCDGDVDGDGQVNPVDSGLVQAAFGSSDDQDLCNYDVDCDGQINPVDSGIVQSLFGTCDPPRDGCP